jgi:hypothetical protein
MLRVDMLSAMTLPPRLNIPSGFFKSLDGAFTGDVSMIESIINDLPSYGYGYNSMFF